jgi:hypothetical protein
MTDSEERFLVSPNSRRNIGAGNTYIKAIRNEKQKLFTNKWDDIKRLWRNQTIIIIIIKTLFIQDKNLIQYN